MKGNPGFGSSSTGGVHILHSWRNKEFLKGLMTGILISVSVWTCFNNLRVQSCEQLQHDQYSGKSGYVDAPTDTRAAGNRQCQKWCVESFKGNGQRLAKFFPVEKFKGDSIWETDKTKERQVMFETSRLRLEMHSVEINHNRIDDWLFVEIPNQINVLAEYRGQFLVFNQTKYGLKGWSLAPVGGYIEPGESPQEAAVRELNEELQLAAGVLHFLGTFRVDVNRGCGFVSLFLAADCRKIKHDLLDSDDLEIHDLKYLSFVQLKETYASFAFKEVKWTASVGMSIDAITENEAVYQSMSSKFKASSKLRTP